jgi:metal transporter CNNM
MAVPALKGLNFLRSKSAPPVPRDGAPAVKRAPGGLLASATEAMAPSPPRVSSAVDFSPVFQDVKLVLPDSALRRNRSGGMAPETPLAALFGNASNQVSAAAGGSGSASPLPIEAILLDRKRRGVPASSHSSAASSGTNTPRSSIVAGPSTMQIVGKGKTGSGFKSSPLVDGGLVGAEVVRKSGGE